MAGEYNLGTARAKIIIDASGASTVLIDTQKQVKKFETDVSGASTTMIGAGAAIGGAGVAIAAGFVGAVSKASDFQKQMNAIQAVSGATGKEMDQLRTKALQLGKDTKYSASEAANAIEELSKAGVSTKDILNGAADAAVNLAAAGAVSLPEAATIASNAMNAFGISAEKLPHVADLIAGAANASAIDVKEFGYSLQQSGAVAHLAGVSFDDLAVAIAEMGNAGIKGSDAGTSLKTFLSNLIPQTKKEVNLFNDLGITTKEAGNRFFDTSGKMKSLADVSQILQDSLKGMNNEQKSSTLYNLFGSDAIRAAAILAENGAKGFNDLSASMAKVTAADTARTRMKGLSGSMEQLKGSIETLQIQIGTPLLGAITSVVNGLNKMVGKFLELSPTSQKVIAIIVGIIGALSLFAGGTLIMLGVIGKAIVGFREFKAAIQVFKELQLLSKAMTALNASFLANPIVLVVVALVAIGAALYLAYKHSKTFHKAVDNLAKALKPAFKDVVGFFEDIPKNIGKAVDYLEKQWKRITKATSNGVDSIGNFFKNIGSGIANAVSAVGNFFSSIPGAIQSGLSSAATAVANFFKAIGRSIEAGASAVSNFFTRLPGQIASGIETGLNALANFLQKLPQMIAYGLGFAIGYFIRFNIETVKSIIDMGSKVLSAIGEFFSQLPGRIWGFLVAAYNFIVTFERNVTQKAIDIGTNVVSTIVTFFSELPGNIWNFLQAAYNFMVSFVTDMTNRAVDIGTKVVNAIINFFTVLPGNIANALTAAYNFVARWVSDMVGRAIDLGSRFVNTIVDFFTQLPGRIANIFTNIYNATAKWIGDMIDRARTLGGNFLNGVVSALQSLPETVGGIFDRALKAVSDRIKQAFDAAKNIASSLWNGFKDGLGIHSPSYIEEAMTRIGANVTDGTKSLAGQMRVLNRTANEFTGLGNKLEMSAGMTVGTTALGAASGGGSVEVNLNFHGVSGEDAQMIKQTVTSKDVLNRLVTAAKAGRK